MKGAVFVALNEMVEQNYGLATWMDILDEAELDGVYTSTETYPDEDIFKLVGVICRKLNAEPPVVLRSFGEFLFHFLHKSHPAFADQQVSFFDFINSIDGVIHVEVHKLDDSVLTPKINVKTLDATHAELSYYSARKLCHLAEGLLTGAGKHYGIEIEIKQTQCMHDGADECLMHIAQV